MPCMPGRSITPPDMASSLKVAIAAYPLTRANSLQRVSCETMPCPLETCAALETRQ